jgi:uncharacterized protein
MGQSVGQSVGQRQARGVLCKAWGLTGAHQVKLGALIGLALMLLWIGAMPSMAQELPSLKQQGQVGEQADGLIGIVAPDKAGGPIRQKVEEINAARLENYKEIATKNAISLEEVQKIMGERLIERANSGEYIKPKEGNWRKK